MMTMRPQIVFRETVRQPNMWNAYMLALGVHAAMFIWNPIILTGGSSLQTPALMQVEFREKMPEIPKPPPPPKPKKEIAQKAKKAGLSLAEMKHKPVPIKPVKKIVKQAAPLPAPRSRPSMVKMPKFVPRATDEDALAAIDRPQKLAQAKALKPAANPFANTTPLKSKSRGIRAADVKFELNERGGISGAGAVVNIPIGTERSDAALVSAPRLVQAPTGRRRISSSMQAPLGDGVGELAGKDRAGYVKAIQVGEPSEEEVIAAGNSRGSAAGRGVEIGGPVGDRKILRRHLPEYPAWAEEKGISALVKIYFTVRPDGTIRQTLRIVRSSGYAELDSLAKEALLAWKFSPTSSSSTDEAWGVVTFRFTLA
jgi:TonB family protein